MWFSKLRRRRPAAVELMPLPPPLEAAPGVWRVFLEQVVALWSAKSWDRQAAERRFVSLVLMLQQHWGVPFPYEMGAYLQDIPVYGDALIPQEVLADDYIVRLRVSMIGNLATVFVWDGAVKPEALVTIIAAAEMWRYIYVPSAALEQLYTGPGAGRQEERTWSRALFDFY